MPSACTVKFKAGTRGEKIIPYKHADHFHTGVRLSCLVCNTCLGLAVWSPSGAINAFANKSFHEMSALLSVPYQLILFCLTGSK